MAEADTQDSSGQCKAVTEDGERCSRPARDDGFCYQHDESDQTVSDSQTVEDQQEEQADQEQREESRSRDLGVDMTAEEKTDPESVETDLEVEHEGIEGVLAVRQTVQSSAGDLIGREFDAVSEIVPTDDGWRAIVEVVERRAVPDTQDIIGRYEIELDEDAVVHGYRRLDRYRRGDTAAFE